MRKLIFVCLLFLLSLSAAAQQMPQAQLTWLRFYTVERGREADFMRLTRESVRPLFERLASQGHIVGWGVAVPMTHAGEPWTHVIYAALPNWTAAEAVGAAIEQSDASLTPAQMQQMMQLASSVREGSVRDVILRHVVQSDMPPPAAKPKYIEVAMYTIKPGRHADAVALFNEWAKPLFNSEGVRAKSGPWGLSVQELATDEPWTHMVWIFETDLSVRDTYAAAQMALGPMKLQGFDVRLRDMSVPEKHRVQLLRIVMP